MIRGSAVRPQNSSARVCSIHVRRHPWYEARLPQRRGIMKPRSVFLRIAVRVIARLSFFCALVLVATGAHADFHK